MTYLKDSIKTQYYETESKCRLCHAAFDGNTEIIASYANLPIAGAYVDPDLAGGREDDPVAPLTMLRCSVCDLVQLEQSLLSAYYKEYSFIGGIGQAYRDYLQSLANDVSAVVQDNACILEIGSGDGTFLEMLQRHGHRVYGFEPAEQPAEQARTKGLTVSSQYFTDSSFLESQYPLPNCIVVRQVLEHIDNFDTVFGGINQAATEHTLLLVEVPDLAETISTGMFGNIYHPHACYFDQTTLKSLLEKYGWTGGDPWIVPVFGGSLFISATHNSLPAVRPSGAISSAEIVSRQDVKDFGARWQQAASGIADFIRNLARENVKVAGYGAAERTSSIIGTAELTAREITCLYDKNPNLVGKHLPASRIPIKHAEEIDTDMPNYMVIFAQSHETEIMDQLSLFRRRGGKCIGLRSDAPIILD
jgi:2-polyprenyl-3-methyl-5-hydroxy-6-metoxy-1,4-benzoquinol methylase